MATGGCFYLLTHKHLYLWVDGTGGSIGLTSLEDISEEEELEDSELQEELEDSDPPDHDVLFCMNGL